MKINTADLCAQAGISMHTLYTLKKGVPHKIPSKLLDYFQASGYSPEALVALQQDYEAWRGSLQKKTSIAGGDAA
ncbi:MAG: helix-turn-helix transcriptional regulator [Candidatus Eremiobacteraeota bacterium]|nr:helix-turn-helix transcriptional regulator [Candidatus Eremiobacteraeota bacterium]